VMLQIVVEAACTVCDEDCVQYSCLLSGSGGNCSDRGSHADSRRVYRGSNRATDHTRTGTRSVLRRTW